MSRRLAILLACVVGLAACAGILGYKRKGGSHAFEHRGHVLKGITCLKCHAGVEKAGDVGPTHIPGTAECVSCHKKPHDTNACDTCHGMPLARLGAASGPDATRHVTSSHRPCLLAVA